MYIGKPLRRVAVDHFGFISGGKGDLQPAVAKNVDVSGFGHRKHVPVFHVSSRMSHFKKSTFYYSSCISGAKSNAF